jgi:prefoldin subunit 5
VFTQADLVKAQEDAAALREGSSDVASLQAQLAAAQEEASGLRNNSEEVEYLQAQLRRTLRQVVELQRQVRDEGVLIRECGWVAVKVQWCV